ncbi:MAG: response regulator [Deltaproteobacteria bacterium]
MHILIVEDDGLSRSVLLKLLRREGHEVDGCIDGQQATEVLRTGDYDALVTDHMMPGITGLDLVRAAREKHPEMRCVVISGLAAPPEAAGVRWVPKPLDFDELLTVLNAA